MFLQNETFLQGKFVISLDFELFWGVRDKLSIENYGAQIRGVRYAIPAMLELFDEFNIAATFSTVGFLFARNRDELLSFFPQVLPEYKVENLSPYKSIRDIGYDETDDPYHFGFSLLKQIVENGSHEIGTHTFSHFYCLEPGQTIDAFQEDLKAARRISESKNISIKSLVFPRNQFNEDYIAVCRNEGIESYRGNPRSWIYSARSSKSETRFQRMMRFLDAYVNISGRNCHTRQYINSSVIANVAASRFLRPYSPVLAFADPLKLKRITSGMLHAATSKKLYHLWWHPHNFGDNLAKNIAFLRKVLIYYKTLKEQYGYQNITMTGLANELKTVNA